MTLVGSQRQRKKKTRLKLAVSFTLLPLYWRGRVPAYLLNRKVAGLQTVWTPRRRNKSLANTGKITIHRASSPRRRIHYPIKLNPLNPELNPICYFLALLGAHHFLHVSRIRVKLLTFRQLMSYKYIYTYIYIYIYIYGAPILDVSRSHTTTQHSR